MVFSDNCGDTVTTFSLGTCYIGCFIMATYRFCLSIKAVKNEDKINYFKKRNSKIHLGIMIIYTIKVLLFICELCEFP